MDFIAIYYMLEGNSKVKQSSQVHFKGFAINLKNYLMT